MSICTHCKYNTVCGDNERTAPCKGRQDVGILSDKIFTPTEYMKIMGYKDQISDNISVEKFDKLVTDVYGLWNYCIEDESEIIENENKAIAVKFKDGTIRYVEVFDDTEIPA